MELFLSICGQNWPLKLPVAITDDSAVCTVFIHWFESIFGINRAEYTSIDWLRDWKKWISNPNYRDHRDHLSNSDGADVCWLTCINPIFFTLGQCTPWPASHFAFCTAICRSMHSVHVRNYCCNACREACNELIFVRHENHFECAVQLLPCIRKWARQRRNQFEQHDDWVVRTHSHFLSFLSIVLIRICANCESQL